MMLGAGIDAVVQILQFLSDEQALKSYVVWTMGSLGNVSGTELWILSAAVLSGLAITAASCKALNLMLLGEDYAVSGGVDVRRWRLAVFLATVLLAGTATAFCGPECGPQGPHPGDAPLRRSADDVMRHHREARRHPHKRRHIPGRHTGCHLDNTQPTEDMITMTMLTIENISLGYGKKILLRDISATAAAGELIMLAGRNGSGKSTLIRSMVGLTPPLSGRILVDGTEISGLPRKKAARKVSFVSTERIRIPWLKCRDMVSMGRAPWTGWAGRLSDTDEQAVADAMETVGMSGFADRTMDSMSDGECQRIMIARALAQDTPLMVLDEPTAFLDVPGRHQITDILERLAAEKGKTVIFSTHDISIGLKRADKVWLIDGDSLIVRNAADAATDILNLFGISGI